MYLVNGLVPSDGIGTSIHQPKAQNGANGGVGGGHGLLQVSCQEEHKTDGDGCTQHAVRKYLCVGVRVEWGQYS